MKAWADANREKRRVSSLAHYYRNRDDYLWYAKNRKYGITPEEYQRLLDKQDGVCAICRQPQHEPGRPLHIDHCHEEKRVRGLLCGNCNRGVGVFKDDPSRLRAAADYLESV